MSNVVELRKEPVSNDAKELSKQIKSRMAKALDCQKDEPCLLVNEYVIDSILSSTFYSGSRSRFYFLNRFGSLVTFTTKEAPKHIEATYGCPISKKLLDDYIEKNAISSDDRKQMNTAKNVYKNVIMDHISLYNQRESIEMRVDMFAGTGYIKLLDESARIVFPHKPFEVGEINSAVIDDYKRHFPNLDDVLSMVVASRFASDRKNAYLWMHCDSDWGKGFFTAALGALGCVVDLSVTEIEKIFSGSPVGRTMADFKRAFVISVDEFKNVKSEVKQLQNTMTLSPKNQLSVSVEIFTKLFTSAESVSSLAGELGIEDQFANRFTLIRGKGSLNDREVYQSIGKHNYFDSVKNYVATKLNAFVSEYIALGRSNAPVKADQNLAAFFEEHRIDKAYERFSDSLPNLAAEMVEYFISQKNNQITVQPCNLDVADRVIKSEDGSFYLKSSAKMIGDYLKSNFDGTHLGSLNKKKAELAILMSVDGNGSSSHRLNGRVSKVVKLT
jgi:hypothetical protein